MKKIALLAVLAVIVLAACSMGSSVVIPDNQTGSGSSGRVSGTDRLVLRFEADGKLAKTMLIKPDGTVTWQPGQVNATPTSIDVWVERNGSVVPYSGSQSVGGMVDTEEFVIGPGDVLDINVWKNQELSRQVPVRPDGRISLPLLGDVLAAGKTPNQLKSQLTADFGRFVATPEITIIVAQINSYKVSVQGMVANPGTYPFSGRATLVKAISLAGGLNEFANRTGIIILRQVPGGTKRIVVNYNAIIDGERPDEVIRPGDSVIVR